MIFKKNGSLTYVHRALSNLQRYAYRFVFLNLHCKAVYPQKHITRLEAYLARQALNITRILQQQEFNLQLLGSERYVLGRLQALDDGDILKIREVFIKQRHTRFMKSFSYHLPFGTKEAYKKEIMNASLEKLTHLVKICGFLMQTKIYLSWRRVDVLAAVTDCQKQSIDKNSARCKETEITSPNCNVVRGVRENVY